MLTAVADAVLLADHLHHEVHSQAPCCRWHEVDTSGADVVVDDVDHLLRVVVPTCEIDATAYCVCGRQSAVATQM